MYVYFWDDPHIPCWKVVNRDFFGGEGVADTELRENVKIKGRLSQSQIIGQIGGSLIVNVRAIDNDISWIGQGSIKYSLWSLNGKK